VRGTAGPSALSVTLHSGPEGGAVAAWEEIVLDCKVPLEGAGPVEVAWEVPALPFRRLHPGDPTVLHTGQYSVWEEAVGGVLVATLRLREAGPGDAGVYRCLAEGPGGRAGEAELFINVEEDAEGEAVTVVPGWSEEEEPGRGGGGRGRLGLLLPCLAFIGILLSARTDDI
jgi:hypothetical protein